MHVSRIKPPSIDDPSPSTKTGSVSLPVARALEVREDLTRGTNAPSDATVKCTSEVDGEEPATRAKPGDRRSTAKAELRERPWYKSSQQPSGFSRLAPHGKTLPASVSMVMPRYFSVCKGTRSDFFSFITIPRCDKARGTTGRPAWLPAPRRR